jgi:hypothetical protein
MDNASPAAGINKPPLTLDELKRKTFVSLAVELGVEDGFESLPAEDIQKAYSNFDEFLDFLNQNQNLARTFKEEGIKVEIVTSGPNATLYDESEKIFKFRYDSDPDNAIDYYKNTLLSSIEGNAEKAEDEKEIVNPDPQEQKSGGTEDPVSKLREKGLGFGEELLRSGHLQEIAEKFHSALEESGIDANIFPAKTLNIGNGVIYYNNVSGFVIPSASNVSTSDIAGFINYCSQPERLNSPNSVYLQEYLKSRSGDTLDKLELPNGKEVKMGDEIDLKKDGNTVKGKVLKISIDSFGRTKVKVDINGAEEEIDPSEILFEAEAQEADKPKQEVSDKEIEEGVSNAKNLDELFGVIRKTKGVKGEGTMYPPETLVSIIKDIWQNPNKMGLEIGAIPEKHGIRSKFVSFVSEREELASQISACNSFDELYEVLRKFGGVQGSQEYTPAETIISNIEKARKFPSKFSLKFITRSAGLREKIEILIQEEQEKIKNFNAEPVVGNKEPEGAEQENAKTEENKTNEPGIPKWRNSEEWEEFSSLRNRVAQAEYELNKVTLFKIKGVSVPNFFKVGFSPDKATSRIEELETSLAEARRTYEDKRNAIAQAIREDLTTIAGNVLTPEQEKELKSKIAHTVFDELVASESASYKQAVDDNREKSWKDKVKIEALKALNSRVVKGYMGLSRKQRLLVSFGIGSVAGLAAGATVAPGMVGIASYLAWRAGRTLASGTAGAVAGEWSAKKWSIEEINKNEEKEIEELKNSDKTLEEKNKEFQEIKIKFGKERAKVMAKRVGVTVAAGAGTGLLTGLAEQYFIGVGGAAKSAAESGGGKAPVPESKSLSTDNSGSRVARGTFNPEQKSSPTQEIASDAKKEVIKAVAQDKPKVAVAPQPEKFFSDPNVLKYEVKSGDSVWRLLNKTMENNSDFKTMTEAQKTYVLSSMSNKVMANPSEFGVSKGGLIEGDKVDLTELFEDSKEVKSVMEKAKQTIVEGSAKEKAILMNNLKITNWLKANPGRELTNDELEEILNTKPVEYIKSPMPEAITENPLDHHYVEPVKSALPENLEKAPMESNTEIARAEGADFAKQSTAPSDSIASPLHAEVTDYHPKVLGQNNESAGGLSDQNKVMPINARPERAFYSDSVFTQRVEEAFRADVDEFYGKSRPLGFGHTPGIDTKEWGEMARLPANRVIEYYTGNPAKSGLPQEIIIRLSSEKKHAAFLQHMTWLIEQSQGAVKPYENNETIEQFVKRLGGYLMKRQPSEIKMAA